MMGRRRWTAAAAVTLVALAVGACVPAVRVAILQRLGWALVAEDPLTQADAIVLTVDVGRAGVLEAADLVHQGIATRVVPLFESPEPVVEEYRRRGIPVEDPVDVITRDLRAAGVSDVAKMPTPVTGTEEQGPVLAQWCAGQRLTSIVVVSLPDHSRRVRRVLRRAMRHSSTRVIVRSARYGLFDPNRWWQSRGGIRTQVEELQKLTVDILRHPLS